MTIKKPYTITKMAKEEAHQVDNQFKTLYENKLESMVHMSGSNAKISSYRRQETGQFWVSGTGSASIDRVVVFNQPFENIHSVIAQALTPGVVATVSDITQSEMTIRCEIPSGNREIGRFTASVTAPDIGIAIEASFKEFNTVTFVAVTPYNVGVIAHVSHVSQTRVNFSVFPRTGTADWSDVFNTSDRVGVYEIIGTRNFSSITTGSVSVHFQVIGSNP